MNLKRGEPIRLDRREFSILKFNDLAGVKAKRQLIPLLRMDVLLTISNPKLVNGKVDTNNLIYGLLGNPQRLQVRIALNH